MRETITCKQCGRVVPKKFARPQIFCSVGCYHKSKRGKKPPIPEYLLGGGIEGHRKQAFALRGRKQSETHIELRIKAARRTLSKQRRKCIQCKQKFTPTQCAQRYCSGRCWNAVHRRPWKPQFRIPKTHYDELFAAQNGACAICGSRNGYSQGGRLVVDHDHKRDSVRGLLCHQCNMGIGAMKDNCELLKKAIKYLRRASRL